MAREKSPLGIPEAIYRENQSETSIVCEGKKVSCWWCLMGNLESVRDCGFSE
jgi:hypothetical protein